jgi:hypothetical protein
VADARYWKLEAFQAHIEPLLGLVDDAYEDIECRKPGIAIAIDNKRKDRLMRPSTIQRCVDHVV